MRERGREAARTSKFVTLETSHASRGWLKAYALEKVPCTRQREMVSKSEARRVRVRGDGWRGREAARTDKVVTLETFHASRGWLKALASQKVRCTRQSEW